jgi:DUF1680 family protein
MSGTATSARQHRGDIAMSVPERFTGVHGRPLATPVSPGSGALRPLGLTEVRITGGFWAERQETNRRATLQHCFDWMTRLGWIANFDRVASGAAFEHAGREFSDSEIYKLLEALAWESARSGDEWVEQTFIGLSERVVAAQQPDGYLNTNFGNPGQGERYSDLEWGHELYCAGHLIQAAVARARTHGHDAFVAAAVRLADHICDTFAEGAIERVCGHPEIEAALVELSRVTGESRYLEQARLFVERRGNGTLGEIEFGAEYFQEDEPVRDATVLRGHAVRALYLAAGAVDVASEKNDDDLLSAVRTQWTNTVAKRTYLTGGMGSRHEGESFGDDFELPSDRAYSETCAGVASVMLSWRLLLADGDSRYADLIERTLYNVIATSPDRYGTAFFYVNPLRRSLPGVPPSSDAPSKRAASSLRAPWFDVSCCPSNVARTIASVGAYVATVSPDGVQVHQYMPAEITTSLPDGEHVSMSIATRYPVDGTVEVTIGSDATREWTLSLRVPGWAEGDATISVNGASSTVSGRTASVTRRFTRGDKILLEFPVVPRVTLPDPRIDALRDSAAVELGPLVLCVESTDVPALRTLDGLAFRPDATLVRDGEDTVQVSATTMVSEDERAWPYGSVGAGGPAGAGESTVTLIPYHRWAQRGPSTMRVWLPVRAV